MSEAELTSWRKFHEKAKADESIANSIKDGATLNLRGKQMGLELTVNSEGKVECKPTDEKKCEEMMTGNVNFNDPAIRDQVCKSLFGMTANESTAVLGAAKEIERRERFAKVAKLTANIQDETEKKQKVAELLKQPTANLDILISLIPGGTPTGNANQPTEEELFYRQFGPNASGSSMVGSEGGSLTRNRQNPQDDDKPDVDGPSKPMPVLNYDSVSPIGKKIRERASA
jgi:hypothetical protein